MLILNYLSLTLGDRFRAGFTGPEVVRLLEAVNRTILAFLGRDRDLAGLGSLLYEGITVPIEFGIEETREQYERHLQGAAEPEAPSDRPETGPATARELLEQTIWSCLVQRK